MCEKKEENLTPDTGEKTLNEELEQLKDTFQAAYDETVKEEQNAPVIQELEEIIPEEDDEEESEEIEDPAPKKSKKAKKEAKTKKKSKIAIILPLILCLFIIVPLFAYFVTTLTVPDFSNFISCIVSAEGASDASTAIDYYEDALSYCEENDSLSFYSQTIHEKITVLTYEQSGYADAYAYMIKNLTDEQIDAPQTSEFKSFIKVCNSINDIANKAFDAVKTAIGDTAAEPDYEAIINELNVPESITEDVTSALESIAAGILAEPDAQTDEEIQEAITNYLQAYSLFTAIGADGQDLLEKIAISMYNNDYVYETVVIMNDYMTEDMISSPLNTEFKTITDDIATIENFTGSFYEIAKTAAADGKTSEDDLTSYITGDFSDSIKKAIASVATYYLEAIEYEDENNLTGAYAVYSTGLSVSETYGITETEAALKAMEIVYTMGDAQTAQSIIESYVTDEVIENMSEETKAAYEEITLVYAAMDAANEVFYPYYYEYAYYGSTIDADALFEELDALITDNSNIYDKAYVEYYKYLTVGFSSADTDDMYEHLNAFAKILPDSKFIYGYGLIDAYTAMGENDKAVALAKELLGVNIADDYCNMIIALDQRKDGDLEAALKTALNGIELSGETVYCTRQAIILYMLDGDFESAYEHGLNLYDASFSVETCELLYVLTALYETDDTELKAELDELYDYIDTVYQSYSVSHTDTTLGIVDGTLSLEDVFLSAEYGYDLI